MRRVLIGDKPDRLQSLFMVVSNGGIIRTRWDKRVAEAAAHGRVFYDLASAQLFVVRERTMFKIHSAFLGRVTVVFVSRSAWEYKGVTFTRDTIVRLKKVEKFLDTLRADELKSIRRG